MTTSSEEELRIKAARHLALVEHHAPKEWLYDGTHAAGNEMLRTVDTVMGFLKGHGWGPLDEYAGIYELQRQALAAVSLLEKDGPQ